LICLLIFGCQPSWAWQEQLTLKLRQLDESFQGELGVVVKNLRTGEGLGYKDKRPWYLSSTVKVLVALSLLEEVERGNISLDQELTLRQENFVDGAGPLIWSEAGKEFTVSYLLKVMLRESDNTATDLLIGLIGLEELNRDVQKWLPGAGPITTLLEVRYLAYSELHPRARELTNMDFVELKNHPLPERHKHFARKLGVPVSELKATDLEEAISRVYAKSVNSAHLAPFAELLSKLERGKILNKKHAHLVLTHMQEMTTGGARIRAGLSPELIFIQKTGTQLRRA
jgi:beta-lactamase class A